MQQRTQCNPPPPLPPSAALPRFPSSWRSRRAVYAGATDCSACDAAIRCGPSARQALDCCGRRGGPPRHASQPLPAASHLSALLSAALRRALPGAHRRAENNWAG
eukprot:63035-Chlamydomonas_euryale.AAC.2